MGKDYRRFYKELFQPLEDQIGRLDDETIMPLVGFEAGGPLSLCTIGRHRGNKFVTYVSCELAIRNDQRTGECGSYEVLITCDDEKWARSILTKIGRMSLEAMFEDAHTLDIGAWVGDEHPMQGILFEELARVRVDGAIHGIMCCHAVTRSELEFARREGADKLYERLKAAGVYPKSATTRPSIPLSS